MHIMDILQNGVWNHQFITIFGEHNDHFMEISF